MWWCSVLKMQDLNPSDDGGVVKSARNTICSPFKMTWEVVYKQCIIVQMSQLQKLGN